METEFRNAMRQLIDMERKIHDALKKLNKEVALYAIGNQVESMNEKYKGTPEVTAYLKAVENDILDNLEPICEKRRRRSPRAISFSNALDERRPLQEIRGKRCY